MTKDNKKKNIIDEKAFEFAKEIVFAYKVMTKEKKEFVMTKQMLRSGTSIGANVREAVESHTKKEFASKMSISLKEANETLYWIQLLHETGYMGKKDYDLLFDNNLEIKRILSAIVKTTKEGLK